VTKKNTTIYQAKTYIMGKQIRRAGGGGKEGLYSREAIEDILSGTKRLKQGLGWVIIHVIWE